MPRTPDAPDAVEPAGSDQRPGCEPLPLPAPGQVARVRRGSTEFVLERGRGAWLLVVHDGARGQRYHLGMPDGSRLQLRPAVPPHRVHVVLEDPVALAPRGRIRGSVVLPLPTRLVWLAPVDELRTTAYRSPPATPPASAPTAGGLGEEELLCVLPPAYSAEWIDGECFHQCLAAFLDQGAVPWADNLLQVPVVLRNDGLTGVSPGGFTVRLAAEDLVPHRGRTVARPRRILFDGTADGRETVRPWPRRRSATIQAFPG